MFKYCVFISQCNKQSTYFYVGEDGKNKQRGEKIVTDGKSVGAGDKAEKEEDDEDDDDDDDYDDDESESGDSEIDDRSISQGRESKEEDSSKKKKSGSFEIVSQNSQGIHICVNLHF